MTGWDLFKSTWDLKPSVVAGSALLSGGYLATVRFHFDRKALLFLTGIGVMFVALVSPLDELGDDYLFSAHMLQHILLDLVVPALLLLGLHERTARSILRWGFAARAERVVGQPVVAWLLGTITLWVWHLPGLYNATLESEGIHIFEHLTFLVTGTILWWPVLAPIAERRLAPLPAIAYLTLAGFANALLGIVFTIASTPFYSGYNQPHDELGALSLIRGEWGLTSIADQQLGGAFMWVLGSIVFLAAILAMLGRWHREEIQ